MNNKKINITLSILTFLLLFIISFSAVYLLNRNTNKLFLDKSKVVSLEFNLVNGKKRNLKYIFPRPENTPIYESISYLSKSDLKKINKYDKKIIIYRFTGNWYKVYFNDTLIGSMGDTRENKSDIWNNFGAYNIDEGLIKDNNEIKIISYNEYEFGLLGYPVIITSNKQAIKIENWVYMILFGVNLVIMGTLVITFIILIILSMFVDYKLHKLDYSYVFYAFAILVIAFTIIDHIQMNVIAYSLLNYKKFITTCYYMSPVLISMALATRFKSRSFKITSALLILATMYIIIVPKDVIELKKTYDITNYLIFITMFSWVKITLRYFKQSLYAKLIFFGTVTHLVFGGYDIINFATGNPFNNLYAYGVFIFSIAIICLVINDIVKMMGNLEFEKKRSEILYQKSITDGMTKIYNHQYLHNVLKETDKSYSLIIVDIDDFKQINDKYGHQTGDEVIKRVATISKKNLFAYDIVGRYGGDEFMIIIFNKNKKEVFEIAELIKKKIETPFTHKEYEIKTSISMGIFSSENEVNYEKVMSLADKGLYKAKKLGKSKIVEYSE